MATITVGGATIVPLLILNSDRSSDEAGNVLIEPIDSPSPYVSLSESPTPTQQLAALFADEAAARAGFDAVCAGLPIVVVTDSRSFTCVKSGRAGYDRAAENRARWILTVEVREL